MSYYTLFCFIVIVGTGSSGDFVEYVPTASCASPSGCDFNGNIWNITGTPSTGDDVYITSDVPITIYANYTNISLNTLVFGSFDSAGVTFILHNSAFQITEKDSDFSPAFWENDNGSSLLVLDNSTFISQSANGNNIEITNGNMQVEWLEISNNANFTSSEVSGDYWYLDNEAYLFSSTITVGTMYVSTALISQGQLTVGHTLILEGRKESVVIIDTETNINTFVFSSFNGSVYFFAPTSNSTLTFGGLQFGNSSCYLNTSLFLGDFVTATAISNTLCNLFIGNGVTLNLGDVWDTEVYQVHQTANDIPATIQLVGWTNFYVPINLFASVRVRENAGMTLSNSVTINGTIEGDGTVSFSGGNLTCTSLSVNKVEYELEGTLNVLSHFNTTLINSWILSNSRIVVNAAETHISNVGITLNTNTIFFNGNFEQTGGFINFTVWSSPDALILVNGSISLTSVTIGGFIPLYTRKILLFRSLSRSIASHNLEFEKSLQPSGITYLIVVEDDNIYIEQMSTTKYFLHENYVYLIIGGVGLSLIIVAVIIVRLRQRKKDGYSRIN